MFQITCIKLWIKYWVNASLLFQELWFPVYTNPLLLNKWISSYIRFWISHPWLKQWMSNDVITGRKGSVWKTESLTHSSSLTVWLTHSPFTQDDATYPNQHSSFIISFIYYFSYGIKYVLVVKFSTTFKNTHREGMDYIPWL